MYSKFGLPRQAFTDLPRCRVQGLLEQRSPNSIDYIRQYTPLSSNPPPPVLHSTPPRRVTSGCTRSSSTVGACSFIHKYDALHASRLYSKTTRRFAGLAEALSTVRHGSASSMTRSSLASRNIPQFNRAACVDGRQSPPLTTREEKSPSHIAFCWMTSQVT